MDPNSDDSLDSDIKTMRNQLNEYGLGDENLSKEEMTDLLKALNNSKCTEKEEEILRQKVEETVCESPPRKRMKRKYVAVTDRRLPWSVLPQNLTQAQRARVLAVYLKIMSISRYRQSRQQTEFESWPTPIQITEESSRLQPMRSTRSGRMVPTYTDVDDDSSDLDFVVAKTKRRKVSGAEVVEGSGGFYANKTFSLKRKSSGDENRRTVKEIKMSPESHKQESSVLIAKELPMDCEY